MEVKINKEIRDYTESVFFGLSIRQLVFSSLAVLIAVALYFLLKGRLGTENLSWVCILAASPFAAMGFIRYHGMNAEELLWAFLRSEVIEPVELTLSPQNAYYEALKGYFTAKDKEAYKKHDKVNKEADIFCSKISCSNFKNIKAKFFDFWDIGNSVSTPFFFPIGVINTEFQDYLLLFFCKNQHSIFSAILRAT